MNLWENSAILKFQDGMWLLGREEVEIGPKKASIQAGMPPNMNEATLWRGGIVICSPGSWLRKW